MDRSNLRTTRAATAGKPSRCPWMTNLAVLLALGCVVLASTLITTDRNAVASLRRLNLQQLCQRSDRIACGEVIELRCYRAPFLTHGEILFTDVTIRVTDPIAGKFKGATITIQVPGGRIGDAFTHCANSPKYQKGEKVLVFLRPYNGRVWNTGWSHGKYRLRETQVGQPRVTSVEGRRGCPVSTTENLSDVRRRIIEGGGDSR